MPDKSLEKLQPGLARRLIALIAVGFLALIGAGVATAWVQSRNADNAEWVEHTLNLQTRLGAFASFNERAETARRGVLLGGGPLFRQRMQEAADNAVATLGAIESETRDNPAQQQRVRELRQLLARQQVHRDPAMLEGARAVRAGKLENDPAVLLIRRVRQVSEEMANTERALLATRQVSQASSQNVFYIILTVAGLLLILVATLTLTLMLRYTRDLAASRVELRRLNQGLEAMVDERTSELLRANAEIQRFAYIVSHDLRSPLVNVMGFTAELDAARNTVSAFLETLEQATPQLISEPVRLAVREDLPEAIGFIRTSTQKMDRLINAILKLSREGRRTLAVEPIDLNALTRNIFDTLQSRVNDAGAELRAEPLPRIDSDRLAVEQILSNLIENALKYLQPGRPGLIRVRGHQERERVVIEVIDNGRGIDPRDHERIFDLFRRSGMQDQPGEGIGLAHVRALAYRLGGLIEVRSELDRGATFRLSLPRILNLGGE